MVADDLVTGLRGASGRGERTHHVVEPLPELPELTGTGGVHGRLQLSVANPDDVTQQRSYGSDDRIAQRTMLPDGQDEDRHEHRELERYTSRDELLIAPRQELAAPIERADENCFRAPISVEERFAFENRWSGAVGPQVGRSPGPTLAPRLFGQTRPQHRRGKLGNGACGGREGLVGSRERALRAGVGLEEVRLPRQKVPAEPRLLVDHRGKGGALRPEGELAPF